LTTLAIIGFGIAGRSLLYTLAKEKKKYSQIYIFHSDDFAFPCTKHSTAIVAPRGVTAGLSALGDLLMDGFNHFSEHVENDVPLGVKKITQYSAATERLGPFKKRYPHGHESLTVGPLHLLDKTYLITERAFMIDPVIYQDWLYSSSKNLPIIDINEFVTQMEKKDQIILTTHSQQKITVDEVVVSAGVYTRFLQGPVKSKPVQGSYLSFKDINLKSDSFSLTLDGDNIVYHADQKILLLGSTSIEAGHELAPMNDLKNIYERLCQKTQMTLPPISEADIFVGLREKAPKRLPYLMSDEKIHFLGGYYKNGFTLALKMAKSLSHRLLGPV